MFNVVGVSQLVTFSHRTDVTARYRTVRWDAIAVQPVHEFKAALVEVTQPPVHPWALATVFIASSFPA